MKIYDDQERLNLECRALERDARWAVPLKFFQTIVAGVILGGSLLFIPDKISALYENSVGKKTTELQKQIDNALMRENAAKKLESEYDNKLSLAKSNDLVLSNAIETATAKETAYEDKLKELTSRNTEENETTTLLQDQLTTLRIEKSDTDAKLKLLGNEHRLALAENISTKKEKDADIELLKSKITEKFPEKVKLAVLEHILSDGGYYSGSVYVEYNIDQKKLSSSKGAHEFKDKVIVLIDSTMSGSATDGILFGVSIVSFNLNGKLKSFNYSDLSSDQMRSEGDYKFYINNHDFKLIGGDITNKKIIETLKAIVS